MASTISKLAILLSLNSQGVTSGLAQAGSSVKSFEGRLKGFGSKFFDDLGGDLNGRLGSIFAGTAAIDAATNAWQQSLQGILDTVDRISDQVDMAGWVGVEQADIARLQYVADLAGVAGDAVGRGLAKMQDFIASAAQAGSSQSATLGRLGLSSDSLAGMDASQRFMVIADAIDRIKDPAQQIRLSMDLFGKSGAQLVPIFNAGTDAIQAAFEKAEWLGQTLSSVDASKIDDVGDRMADLEKAIEGAYNALVVEAAPGMISSLEQLTAATVFLTENSETLYGLYYKLSMPAMWPVRGFLAAMEASGMFEKAIEDAKAQEELVNSLAGAKAPDGMDSNESYEADQAAAESAEKAADDAKKAADELTREQERAHDSLMRRGDALRESLLTPVEEAMVALADFDELAKGGAIGYATKQRGIQAAWEEAAEKLLADDMPKMPAAYVDPSAGLVERGTAAAFSAERQGQNTLKEMVAQQKRSNDLQEKQNEKLDALREAFRQAGVTVNKQRI